QAIVAFVTPRGSVAEDESSGTAFVQSLRDHVAKSIGPIAKPRQVLVTPELPKTRSGKIMRRLLRDIAENRELGDVTTLLDPSVTDAIRTSMASSGSGED
ncbi:MAG TPA: acetyl-coenzyme A synthetase, partial [Mycobacteriales bacterium]